MIANGRYPAGMRCPMCGVEDTRVIELPDAAVILPGFVDSHIHPVFDLTGRASLAWAKRALVVSCSDCGRMSRWPIASG